MQQRWPGATMACPNCNRPIPTTSLICEFCRYEIVRRRRNGKAESWATASLVLGICGIVVGIIPFLLPALALHYGKRARRELGSSSPSLGLATAGIVLGWVGVGFGVLWVFSFFIVFGRVLSPPH